MIPIGHTSTNGGGSIVLVCRSIIEPQNPFDFTSNIHHFKTKGVAGLWCQERLTLESSLSQCSSQIPKPNISCSGIMVVLETIHHRLDTYSGSFSSLSCALELSALPWWHSCVVSCRFMVVGTTPTRTYPKHPKIFTLFP